MIGDVGFIHLRVHSAYSLLEGALPLVKALKLAVADNQPALAITDTGNLFCALEFSEKALEKGLQPIIGCEMAVDFGDDTADRRRPGGLSQALPSIVLLAATAEGLPI
jgi:DNA polymerase III, alpha subunit (EC 2.7.7.7)